MERKVVLAPGEFYHIYNRGIDKRDIFVDEYDYQRFIKFLYLANNTSPVKLRESPSDAFSLRRPGTLVDIGAYCLMPNHFHILIKEHSEGGISRFMSKLLTSHSSFFNKKYKRTGRLFEDRFKVKHADTDEYLKYLFAYIHLNPVKLIDSKWKERGISDIQKAMSYLIRYPHSSYLDYHDNANSYRKESKILNKQTFPDYFEKTSNFDSMISDWLNYKDLDL